MYDCVIPATIFLINKFDLIKTKKNYFVITILVSLGLHFVINEEKQYKKSQILI